MVFVCTAARESRRCDRDRVSDKYCHRLHLGSTQLMCVPELATPLELWHIERKRVIKELASAQWGACSAYGN